MRPLSELPTWDPETGDLTMVIETPQGSRNKYSYDPDTGAFDLGWVLPPGSSFPYDFGFIPSTIAEDGDALDVLVLLDVPVAVGCVVAGRVIGAIQAKQRAPGGKWIRNDRLLAVAKHAHLHQHIKSLDDLRPHMVEEIEEFFIDYNRMRERDFKPLEICGPKKSRKLIEKACDALGRKAK
jgi:inorganic pyrophosphatase